MNFIAHLIRRDGYGYAATKIAEALLDAYGDGVNIVDMSNGRGWDDIKRGKVWELEGPTVMMGVPDWLPNIKTTGPLIALTMFEASKLPAGWADLINTHAEAVIVPCPWAAEMFRNNGVIPPIYPIKWGVDQREYHWVPRVNDTADGDGEAPYTFLWSGNPDRRKGWDVAYRAFYNAFGADRPGVRLRLHFRSPLPGGVTFDDPNVEVITGRFFQNELREILRTADAFVYPTRGEGWGMPPREAAATGLPVIATNYGGTAVDIEKWAYALNINGFSKADYGFWGDTEDLGFWPEPDPDHLAHIMVGLYGNPEAGVRKGAAAADWLRINATWAKTAQEIMGVMNGYQ